MHLVMQYPREATRIGFDTELERDGYAAYAESK